MAKSINQVTIMGNLTQFPELKQTPSGQSVVTLSVALNRSYKDAKGEWQESTDFVDVVAWGRLAEQAGELTKGARVLVNGRLQTRQWEKDGIKRSKTEVLALDIIFLAAQERVNDVEAPETKSDAIDLSEIPFN